MGLGIQALYNVFSTFVIQNYFCSIYSYSTVPSVTHLYVIAQRDATFYMYLLVIDNAMMIFRDNLRCRHHCCRSSGRHLLQATTAPAGSQRSGRFWAGGAGGRRSEDDRAGEDPDDQHQRIGRESGSARVLPAQDWRLPVIRIFRLIAGYMNWKWRRHLAHYRHGQIYCA